MLCHLDSLREQLRFPQLIGANISYSLAGAKSSVTMNGTNWCSAISSYVMRAGKHTATFIISSEDTSVSLSVNLSDDGDVQLAEAALQLAASSLGSGSRNEEEDDDRAPVR